jgi:hypothetical protein
MYPHHRNIDDDLSEHQIKPGSEFPCKMPHRPVGPLADKTKRVCITGTRPIHSLLEQRRAYALSSPSFINTYVRLDATLRDTRSADNAPYFIRNKKSRRPRRRRRKHPTHGLEELIARAAGATQQIKNVSLAARAELPHHPVGATADRIAVRCNHRHIGELRLELLTDS